MNGNFKKEHDAVQVIASLFDTALRAGAYGFDEAASVIDNVRLVNNHFAIGLPGILAQIGSEVQPEEWSEPQNIFIPEPELARTIDPESIPGTEDKIAKPVPGSTKKRGKS